MKSLIATYDLSSFLKHEINSSSDRNDAFSREGTLSSYLIRSEWFKIDNAREHRFNEGESIDNGLSKMLVRGCGIRWCHIKFPFNKFDRTCAYRASPFDLKDILLTSHAKCIIPCWHIIFPVTLTFGICCLISGVEFHCIKMDLRRIEISIHVYRNH